MLAPRDDFETGLLRAIPQLRWFAMKLTRDPVHADDLVQETMLRALVHRDKYQAGTNMMAWLLTIERNFYYSAHRKRKFEVEDPENLIGKATPIEDDPQRKMEAKEALEMVEMLPFNYRVPLKMLADGASYQEIAEETGEHEGTVKSRIYRGRVELARIG